jgi:hypothetical protein
MADAIIAKSNKPYNLKSGDRYNHLVLISFVERRKSQIRWLCQCDCGKQVVCIMDNLRRNHTTSCGCDRSEKTRARMTTHGDSRNNAEYRCWLNMRNRCYYVPHKDYKDYGGRGIIVCDEWRYSYETFLSDMGRKPTTDHSIERIDTNGNYEPSNCKWETLENQSKNKRRAVFVNYNGEKRYLVDVCRERGVNSRLVRGRIYWGWNLEEALSTPSNRD